MEWSEIAVAVAALGALWNSYQISRLSDQISRLSGRVDVLEHTFQTVLMILAGRGAQPAPTPRDPDVAAGGLLHMTEGREPLPKP